MISPWVDLTFTVLGNTFALVCLFEGARQIGSTGIHKKAVALALFGSIYFLAHAGFSYWANHFQLQTSALIRKGVNIPELPQNWGSNLPIEKRATSSLETARAAFFEHGRLHHYFGNSGERQMFVPNQNDLMERESRVASLAKLEYAAEQSSNVPAHWLLTTISAVLFGFGFGRSRSTKTGNEHIAV